MGDPCPFVPFPAPDFWLRVPLTVSPSFMSLSLDSNAYDLSHTITCRG